MFFIRSIIREELENAVGSSDSAVKLSNEVEALKSQIRELEHKKQLEERELQHLVKMKEEKIAIETEKKHLDLQQEYDKKVMEMQKDYHERVLALLQKEHGQMKEVYEQIMARLPNVNMAITRRA